MEEWKEIPGYNGTYLISNYGNVFSRIRNRRLKHYLDKAGYERTGLTMNRKTKLTYIHRLVGLCFVPNPEQKPYINHLDFNRSNNIAKNIEWVTYEENIKYSRLHDKFKFSEARREQQRLICLGEGSPTAKLKDEDILKIRQIKLTGLSNTKIGDLFGVNRRTIDAVLNGLTWSHIK